MMEDEIVLSFDRHSNEHLTLRKHVPKYKHMRKWMVVSLSKSESHGNKIALVNLIHISKFNN